MSIFRSEINVKSTTATMVVWLQNESGYNKYKPNDAAIDAFLESYRPGKDKNAENNNSTAEVTTTTPASPITTTTNNNNSTPAVNNS